VKDQIIKDREKEIEISLEKFVEKSKDLIHTFKIDFKKFIVNQTKEMANTPNDELEKKIGLKQLKEDLYSAEIYLKYKMGEKITAFMSMLRKEDDQMGTKTTNLKDNLDKSRKRFKQELSLAYQEIMDTLSKQDQRTPDEESLFNEVNSIY